MSNLWVPAFSRRALLRYGGVASLGALVAACGDRGGDETPGRVGAAPTATDRPTGEVNDVILLRTAQSLEYTAIDVYGTFEDEGLVDAAFTEAFAAFVDDHQEHADTLGGLITAAGGDEFACPNPWIMSRAVGPILDNILGDEAQDIPVSDNPQRDAVATALAFENLAGATYQALVASLAERELRGEVVRIAAEEARHASVIALLATGVPKAYVSPVLAPPETPETSGETGTTTAATEDPATAGRPTAYVLTDRFGSLAAATLAVGKPNEAGTRFSATLETPAENSFIYEQMTCAAAGS